VSLFVGISLTVSISCVLLAIFTFMNAQNRSHYIWGIFNLTVAAWGLGIFLVGLAVTPEDALIRWKLTYLPCIFIPVVFYHLVTEFCEIKKLGLLFFSYIQGFLFAPLIVFSDFVIGDTFYLFDSIHYHKVTFLFVVWLGLWFFIVGLAFFELYKYIKKTKGDQRRQGRYLFWGMILGHTGGVITVIPAFDIPVYPAWHFSICVYAAIVTYAILRHHFLDIRIGLIRLLIPTCICMVSLLVFCFIYFDMNLFSVASLSVAIICALLAFIVFAYSTQNVHKLWALFNVIIAIWGFANFGAGMSTAPETALLFWRLTYLACTFIAVVFYHVIIEFCQVDRRRMLFFAYLQGFMFVLLIILSDSVIGTTFYLFDSIHYPKATFLFAVWLGTWFVITGSAFVEMHRFIKRSKGIQKTQALYLFWGMMLGHTGGAITVIPAFNILIYPAWHFSVCVYAVISTYAIFRYQVMDIKIVGTRVGIFVLVYSLVLGIPIGLDIGGKEWLIERLGLFGEWIPRLTMLLFATLGPFIYIFIQKKAEEQLLQEENRRHDLLKKSAIGMNTIHDLPSFTQKLGSLITKIFNLRQVSIFLLDKERDRYSQQYSSVKNESIKVLQNDSPLIKYLYANGLKVVAIEAFEFNSSIEKNKKILAEMKNMSASLVIPMVHYKILLGFITMDSLPSGDPYSKNDLDILGVLGSNIGLAIDSCYAWEEHTKILDERGVLERMTSLDMMAGSIAHEIHNPIHAITQEVGYIRAVVKDMKGCLVEEDYQGLTEAGSNIDELANRVKNMVNTILQFSKKGNTELEQVAMEDVVNDFEILMNPHFKHEAIHFTKNIAENLPDIYVNRVLLVTALMNFAKNSIHATQYEKIKKIHLKIVALKSKVRIEFKDNGCGIEAHKLQGVFTAFQTSKGTSEGTGLGLYRARRDIVDHFKGKLWAESKGMGHGVKIICEFPLHAKAS